jgi:ribosomal 30S subunit maturation factor RimM
VQGGDDRIHLIPFVPEIIQDVDLTQKQITVLWDANW